MKRKLLSLFLCLTMLLTVAPLTAFATTRVTTVFLSGYALPSVGDTAGDFVSVVSQQPDLYTVVDCFWYDDSEGKYVSNDSTFQRDTLYSLCCVVEAKPGYSLETVSSYYLDGSSQYLDSYYTGYDSEYNTYKVWTLSTTVGGAISNVNISGHKSPYVGDTAGSHIIDLTVSDPRYSVTSAAWFCENDSQYMDDDTVFEAGKEYSLGMVLSPIEGFYFADETLNNLYINDFSDYADSEYTYISEEGKLVLWTLPMEAFVPEVINTISLYDFFPAVIGNTAGSHYGITTYSEPVEILHTYWYCDTNDASMQEMATFEAGLEYSMGIFLRPYDGYVFSDDISVSVNYGIEWVDPSYTGLDEYGNLDVWTIAHTPLTAISTVNVLDIPTPVAGQRAGDFNIRLPNGAHYSISSASWFCDTTFETLEEDDVFEVGNEYSFCVDLIPEEGYGFSSVLNFLVDGQSTRVDSRYCGSSSYDTPYAYLWSIPTVALESAPAGVVGDANGDGEVGSSDLTALARHVGGISQITDSALLSNANVNSDGELDSADLTMLARYVGGIINEF